jgi:hypothetical protein
MALLINENNENLLGQVQGFSICSASLRIKCKYSLPMLNPYRGRDGRNW